MHRVKTNRWWWSAVAVAALALVWVSARPVGAEPAVAAGKTVQRMVRARVDGGTFLMMGDPLIGTDKALDGGAVPYLIGQGYRVVAVHMTASAGVNPEQHAALIMLEKTE